MLAVLIGMTLFGCQSTKPKTSSVTVTTVPSSLPKTMAELAPPAPKDPLQDARPILEKAYALSPLESVLLNIKLFKLLGAEDGQPQEFSLEPNVLRALDLLVEASKKPVLSSRRNWKWYDPSGSVDPILSYVGHGAGVLCYRGMNYARKGNTEAALVDFRAALSLVRFTLQEPFAHSPATAAKLYGAILEDLEVALVSFERDKDSLAKVRAMLDEVTPKTIDPSKFLRGEVLYSFANENFSLELSKRRDERERARNWNGKSKNSLYYFQPSSKDDEYLGVPYPFAQGNQRTRTIQFWEKAMQIAAEVKHLSQLDQILEEEADRLPKPEVVNGIARGGVGKLAFEVGANVARCMRPFYTTRALVTALEFRLKSGRWPTSLEELPPIPSDPYTGYDCTMLEDKGKFYISYPYITIKDHSSIGSGTLKEPGSHSVFPRDKNKR